MESFKMLADEHKTKTQKLLTRISTCMSVAYRNTYIVKYIKLD